MSQTAWVTAMALALMTFSTEAQARPRWDTIKKDGCSSHGMRQYSARLWDANDWMRDCKRTPNGRFGKPNRCDDHGWGGMWGIWFVKDATCGTARWGGVQNKGCTGYRQRTYASRLEDTVSPDWMGECRATPITLAGQRINTPTRCRDLGVSGQWGEWDVADKTCGDSARWDSWTESSCRDDGTRTYFSRLRETETNDWNAECQGTAPGTVGGQSFSAPTRCVNKGVAGMYGEVDVRDQACPVRGAHSLRIAPSAPQGGPTTTCSKTEPGRLDCLGMSRRQEFTILVADQALQSPYVELLIKPILSVGPSGEEFLHIDLDGSNVGVGPRADAMASNTDQDRGYFISKIDTEIWVKNTSLTLVKASLEPSPVETGTVTSSTEQSLSGGVDIGADGPSGSFGVASTVGVSHTRDLKGFEARSDIRGSNNGQPVARQTYEMSGMLDYESDTLLPYEQPKDLVVMAEGFWEGVKSVFTTTAWQPFHLHKVPQIARSSFDVPSQALFRASPGFAERVNVTAKVTVTLNRVYTVGNTQLDSRWKSAAPVTLVVSQDFVVDMGRNEAL